MSIFSPIVFFNLIEDVGTTPKLTPVLTMQVKIWLENSQTNESTLLKTQQESLSLKNPQIVVNQSSILFQRIRR